MGIFTYTKTISSEDSGSVVSAETYSGLGTSKEGKTLPSSMTTAPNVYIKGEESRSLYADDITTSGFNIKGRDTGVAPPYQAQIMIVTYAGASIDTSAHTVGVALERIQDTYFNLPNGKFDNLHSTEGIKIFSRPKILNVWNRAQRDLNLEIEDDFDFYNLTLVSDQDWIALQLEEIFIRDVIILADSGDDRGTPMERLNSYESLVERGWGLTGKPDAYIIEKGTRSNTLSRFLRFNKTPDDTYTIEVRHWKLSDDSDNDGDFPSIWVAYHKAIEYLACKEIALAIGDRTRMLEFDSEYEKAVVKYGRAQRKFNAPGDRVRYMDIGKTLH